MNNLPLIAPARVDFSGIGDLPGQYRQAQNQAEELRALAEGREREQQARAAIGALDLEQPLTNQLGPLVQSGAIDPGKAFGLIQEDQQRQVAQQRTENIRRGLFGDGQTPGALARSGLTQEDIEMFSLMEPEEALAAYQEARQGTDDIQEYNFARQQGYGGTFRDFMLSSKRAGATNITTNVSTSGNQFAKELGGGLAKDFIARRETASQAADSLRSTAEARKLLDAGIITGVGAEWQVAAGKALQKVGINFADDAIANTEAYGAAQAKEVGRVIQLFGAGTGLSDADREFARKAAAGEITMTESALRRILDINERASRNVLTKFNNEAAQIDPALAPFPLAIEVPDLSQGAGSPTPASNDGWSVRVK